MPLRGHELSDDLKNQLSNMDQDNFKVFIENQKGLDGIEYAAVVNFWRKQHDYSVVDYKKLFPKEYNDWHKKYEKYKAKNEELMVYVRFGRSDPWTPEDIRSFIDLSDSMNSTALVKEFGRSLHSIRNMRKRFNASRSLSDKGLGTIFHFMILPEKELFQLLREHKSAK